MNLVWHIAKKDVRRMAVPVGCWLVFILAGTIWFRLSSPPAEGDLSSGVFAWARLMDIWSLLLYGARFVIGFILAGALVLEDPVFGTNQFWPTRPIASARLLGAKAISAGILFLLAPLAVQAPVWLASGFTLEEAGRAAGEFVQRQGLVTLAAFAMAATTANLVQFLFGTLGTIAAGTALAMGMAAVLPQEQISFFDRRAIGLLMLDGAVVMAGMVTIRHFLGRRFGRSWILLSVTSIIGLLLVLQWPARLWTRMASYRLPSSIIAVPGVEVDVRDSSRKDRPLAVSVNAPWSRETFFLPSLARGSDGTPLVYLNEGWEVAGRRLLGFDSGQGPIRWTGTMRDDKAGHLVEQSAGEIEVHEVRAQVAGEIPLREGAALKHGSNRTRILGFGRTNGRVDAVFLVESLATEDSAFHRYFLVNRTSGTAQLLDFSNIGAAELNSVLINCWRLPLSPEVEGTDAMLVKVRFEPVRAYRHPFSIPRAETEKMP